MRIVLAALALTLAACAAESATEVVSETNAHVIEPDVQAHLNRGLQKEKETVEINKELDGLLDLLETNISNSESVPTDERVREYRAIRQQIGDAKLSHEQQARYAALTVSFEKPIHTASQNTSNRLAEAYNPSLTQLACHGIVKQGGLVVCQTTPNARVEVGRSENDTYTQTAGPDGRILIGFDRDEPNAFVRVGDQRVDFEIEKRSYDTSRIDGLPKNMVSEYTPDELKHIRKASALKKIGFASLVEEIGFENGFIFPIAEYVKTTNFGAQRILNGDPKRPHFGVDLAAPKGTPIVAPAAGIVSLASEEMYFEGSLIMIDHGQGLISYYLHNEEVLVEEGQRVEQGQQIATVGSRGRSTGPHLCWRLKWRGRNLDPELLTEWPQKG